MHTNDATVVVVLEIHKLQYYISERKLEIYEVLNSEYLLSKVKNVKCADIPNS